VVWWGNGRVGFVDEGGEAVDTVLGLSMTSSSIGWVLLDGPGADATTLDHDVFDVGADVANDGDISKHTAAVRGAQTIASASGHQVKSIGVTWTDDADPKASLLLKSLSDLGFDNIVRVRLPEATRSWARTFGRSLEFEKCAVCVVESAAVTALSYGYDTVRTFATQMRESVDGLSRWLNDVVEKNKLQPDTLFLVGSRGDLELISGSLGEALPMPVDASEDAQLALARGAALAVPAKTETIPETVAETPADDIPNRGRSWFGPHARAGTVLVAGVIALFALGPELAGQSESKPHRPASNSAASNSAATSKSPATSVSVPAVPTPAVAPSAPGVVRPLAAQPAPVPAPPAAPPPTEEAIAPAADTGSGQETATPVEQPAPASIVAQPLVAPQAPVAPQPAVAPQAPVAPQPLVAPQAPVAPQPPFAWPALAPPPPAAPQPLVAPLAPLAPPALAPPPPAAPPPALDAGAPEAPPGAPIPPPTPPPDPLAVVLSPIFGALP
jgi:hypothetical protein